MLDLVFANETPDSVWSESFFRNVIERSLEYLKLEGKKVELGLYLIGPERSQELNRAHRGKDKPTDVLSFPLNEHGLEEKYDILPLGDIFICLEVADKQAGEMEIPLDQELARLAVHGLLHLLGYDHERSASDEEAMIALQEKILEHITTI